MPRKPSIPECLVGARRDESSTSAAGLFGLIAQFCRSATPRPSLGRAAGHEPRRVFGTTACPRDQWIDAGVFDELVIEALAAFDRIIGLDLDDVALDGSLHKAPYGGEGTGPNPTDRAKSGWKWSVACDRHGIPIGWAIDGANRNDVRMLEPTLDAIREAGLLVDIGTLHLDRGYDSNAVRQRLRDAASSSSRSSSVAPRSPARRNSRSVSGCARSLKRPTPGGRTTGNSGATPTARPATAMPRSASRPPSSSSPDSSTTGDDGAPNRRLSAQVLRR